MVGLRDASAHRVVRTEEFSTLNWLDDPSGSGWSSVGWSDSLVACGGVPNVGPPARDKSSMAL